MCSVSSFALIIAWFGVDGHVMHVRIPNTPGIAVRIDIFQLTQTGFSISLHVLVPVRSLNLSNILHIHVGHLVGDTLLLMFGCALAISS